MPFLALPTELQLVVARRLDVRDRLALGCASHSTTSLVVFTAILEFRLGNKAHFVHRPEYDVQIDDMRESAAVLDKVRFGRFASCVAQPTSRKKGHILPLYEATEFLRGVNSVHDLDSLGKLPAHAMQITQGKCGGRTNPSSLQQWPWEAFTALGMPRFPTPVTSSSAASAHHLLPIALAPEYVSLGLSDATLNVMHTKYVAAPLPRRPPIQTSLKSTLVAIDMSRAQHVTTLGCSGLGALRRARLPPDCLVACFDGCAQLAELLPTAGAAKLLSLQCDGCRSLSDASFRVAATASGDAGPSSSADALACCWQLARLEELNLSWCACIHARTLVSLLPTAPCLRSVSLRGLSLHGVLEAIASPPLASLTAADLSFSKGLESDVVLAFVASQSAIGRCNLRAAAGVSAAAYNEVGRLLQARTTQPDVVENRRRPRNLAPRAAEPFYYLKRQRGS